MTKSHWPVASEEYLIDVINGLITDQKWREEE